MYVTLLRENGLPAGALLRRATREACEAEARTFKGTHVAVGLRSLAASGGCTLRAMRTTRSLRAGCVSASQGRRARLRRVPHGMREQVVQAQRGEGGAANGEKGERVAQKGADEYEHGEAEVVHAVVVDCPSGGRR